MTVENGTQFSAYIIYVTSSRKRCNSSYVTSLNLIIKNAFKYIVTFRAPSIGSVGRKVVYRFNGRLEQLQMLLVQAYANRHQFMLRTFR